MKCQILFSGKIKKNIINLSSAENAQSVVKVKKYKLIRHPAVGNKPVQRVVVEESTWRKWVNNVCLVIQINC